MKKTVAKTVAGVTLVLMSVAAVAQDVAVEPASPQFEGIEVRLLEDNLITRELITVEGLRLNMYGGGVMVFDDNVYSQETDEAEDSAFVKTVGGALVFDRGGDFRLALDTVYRKFDYDDLDSDYETYTFSGESSLDLTERATLNVSAAHERDVGQVDPSIPYIADVKTDTDTVEAGISYTATERSGIDLTLGWSEKQYVNNKDVYSDSETTEATLSGYHNLTPKTRLLGEFILGATDFDGNAVNDSDMWQTNLGVMHRLTNKVTGTAKLGYQKRDYDNMTQGGGDFDDLVYSLSLNYQPSPHWKHSLVGMQTAQNSQGAYNYYEYKRLAYNAVFTPMAKLKLSGGLFVDNTDPSAVNDESDRVGAQASVTYALTELVTLGASYKYTDKSSDQDSLEYSRNVASLGMWFTF